MKWPRLKSTRMNSRLAMIVFAACGLMLGSAPAGASVTIGQVGPLNPPTNCGASARDLLQPMVTSGNSYVVKGGGTITSWSTSASLPTGAITLKTFRKIGEPAQFQAVRHDGPRFLSPGVLNSFNASIPVTAGEYLGSNLSGNTSACTFPAPGESFLNRLGDLGDGAAGPFSAKIEERVNIAAVIDPSNAFTFGEVTRNKKKGSATLTITLPGPGALMTSGKGVKSTEATASQAGAIELLVKAKSKAKHELNESGKTKLKLSVAYTPTGGSLGRQSTKIKLKKKH